MRFFDFPYSFYYTNLSGIVYSKVTNRDCSRTPVINFRYCSTLIKYSKSINPKALKYSRHNIHALFYIKAKGKFEEYLLLPHYNLGFHRWNCPQRPHGLSSPYLLFSIVRYQDGSISARMKDTSIKKLKEEA